LYIPHSKDDQAAMLAKVGAKSLDELFDVIPETVRLREPLNIPPAMTEMDLEAHLGRLASNNIGADRAVCFLGGGCYDHFVPAVVDVVAGRSEFYTAYTPYQAEASQGTLQTGFEYQSLICELSGMDVSNASMYEGATAATEACLMARAASGKTGSIVVSETVHPEYRQTLETYLVDLGTKLVVAPAKDGLTDPAALAKLIDAQTACVLLQHPNFFGLLEPMDALVSAAKSAGVPVVQAFDPMSVGLLKRPGDYGVDVAVTEGQALGTPMQYGGPFLGVFACKNNFVRKIPGRVVGQTVDRRGNRCFVLTLQTREQHIRREKATSNICTNQGLLALRASVYLALMGPQGMKEAAELCWAKAHYAADRLSQVKGLSVRFSGAFFKEFVLKTPGKAEQYLSPLLKAGFHAGVPLGRWYKGMDDCLLVAVTEKRTKDEIDRLADAWTKVLGA